MGLSDWVGAADPDDSRAQVDSARAALWIGSVQVARDGVGTGVSKDEARAQMHGAEVTMRVDLGLGGTGLSRPPEGAFATWIESINSSGLPVIAIDVPSGLDADTGFAYPPTVHAKSTVTLGLPKPGLLVGDGPRLAGEVWVVDIGVPFEAYAALGIDVPQDLFAHGDQVRLDSFR